MTGRKQRLKVSSLFLIVVDVLYIVELLFCDFSINYLTVGKLVKETYLRDNFRDLLLSAVEKNSSLDWNR